MAWASGSELLEDILDLIYEYIPANKKKKICKELIDVFENQDCDTVQEVFSTKWLELEEVYREMYPEYFEHDDE